MFYILIMMVVAQLYIYLSVCQDSWNYLFYVSYTLIKVMKIIKPYLSENKTAFLLGLPLWSVSWVMALWMTLVPSMETCISRPSVNTGWIQVGPVGFGVTIHCLLIWWARKSIHYLQSCLRKDLHLELEILRFQGLSFQIYWWHKRYKEDNSELYALSSSQRSVGTWQCF